MTALLNDTLFIFDCDGVLVDSEYIIATVEAALLTKEGYPLTPEEDIKLFSGKSQRYMLDTVEVSLGRRLPKDFGKQIEREATKTLSEQLLPCKHIQKLLKKTKQKCVASSGSLAMIHHSLKTTGLDSFFPSTNVFSAVMVEKGKPYPDIFLFSAQKMGYAPENCIVFEDSFAGVQAAQAAGMKSIGYVGASHIIDPNHATKLKQLGAEEVFTSILEIIQFLEERCQS